MLVIYTQPSLCPINKTHRKVRNTHRKVRKYYSSKPFWKPVQMNRNNFTTLSSRGSAITGCFSKRLDNVELYVFGCLWQFKGLAGSRFTGALWPMLGLMYRRPGFHCGIIWDMVYDVTNFGTNILIPERFVQWFNSHLHFIWFVVKLTWNKNINFSFYEYSIYKNPLNNIIKYTKQVNLGGGFCFSRCITMNTKSEQMNATAGNSNSNTHYECVLAYLYYPTVLFHS